MGGVDASSIEGALFAERFVPPIEVVHAFGSCPESVRDKICALDAERVVYVIGSRVAVTAADGDASNRSKKSGNGGGGGGSRELEFLSTGLRVARVTCVTCSPDGRFVAVCYKAVAEDAKTLATAYATIYHMPTRPQASRVKTLSYERQSRQQYQQQRDRVFLESVSSSSSSISSNINRFDACSSNSSSGDCHQRGCKRRALSPPPKPLPSATAEFVAATFSHDGCILAVLDGSPEWTLLWFDWKTGKRMFTLSLDSTVHRVAVSPLDHNKTATAGAGGLLRIWRTQQGGKVSPMVPIAGLKDDACYRDVAWLNGDRLVAVAHEGIVVLLSPSEVLQEWNVGGANEQDPSGLPSPNARATVIGGVGKSPDSIATSGSLFQGTGDGESLNAVAMHERGFVVGGSRGNVLVFEQECEAGGTGRDSFALTRLVRVFGVGVVELRPILGPDCRYLLIGAEDGEIGLINVNGLFRATPDGDSSSSAIGGDGGFESEVQRREATATGGGTGAASDARKAVIRHRHPSPQASKLGAQHTVAVAAGAAAAAATKVTLETVSADGESVVARGFAKAMDAFEDSIRAAAADLGSTGSESRPQQQQQQQQQRAARGGRAAAPAKVMGAATSCSSTSSSLQSGDPLKPPPLYHVVARGLDMSGGKSPSSNRNGNAATRRDRREGSLSCLTVCARKPLLAGIARGGAAFSAAVATAGRIRETDRIDNEELSGVSGAAASDGPRGERQRQEQQQQNCPAAAGSSAELPGGAAEIQIWNYRTKQMVVRHLFGRDASPQSGDVDDTLLGSVIDAGVDEQRGVGGGRIDADREGGGRVHRDADPTCPVAISLHPSGDSIAVAFPHYVNVFYLVGQGGGSDGDRGADSDDGAVAEDTLSASPPQLLGVAEAAAAAEAGPLATLRSDQREFLTKGMFSVPGEKEPVINCDPVSAVHFSPGGHLLAVVTGKVVQILGVYSGTAGGRLGRVQTLSGHASDIASFCWGAHDRTCWTAAGGYLFEWEVGAGMGALGADKVRRGEFVSKRAVFEGIVADPALDGGVVACGVFDDGDGGSGSGGGRGGGGSGHGGSCGGRGAQRRGNGLEITASAALTRSSNTKVVVAAAEEAVGVGATAMGMNASKEAITNQTASKNGGHANDVVAPGPAEAGGISESRGAFENNSISKISSKRSREAPVFAATSTCATTGGSLTPIALLPRGSAAAANSCGGRQAAATTHPLGAGSERDRRQSSVFVWPSKLEVTSGEAGLETRVPYRLTCVRATAFEARFRGARNALLAGTTEGMALAFDWGCLLRDSCGGGGDEESEGDSRGKHGEVLAPSAQVCLHSQPITSLALTADGRHFFTSAGDGAVFMCKIQLEGRKAAGADDRGGSGAPASAAGRLAPRTTQGVMEIASAQDTTAARAAVEDESGGAGGSCMALEAGVEEGMVLMEEDAVGRLQAKAASARQQLVQVKHQARFQLEKSRRDQQKELAAVKAAGKQELHLAEADAAKLRSALMESKQARDDLARASAEQRKREASAMSAIYERKLALQAESYMQLKIAYEELSQAAADDVKEVKARAERAVKQHETSKREDMERILEDHRVLSSYVDFVGAQFHKVIDDEQHGHDKQVNVLRASEEIGEIEKSRVKEKANAEVLAAKKELRTLSKRMELQCTREVDSALALEAEKQKSENLEARVNTLEQEVRAKAQRLSEWENMTDKQKTAVSELEKLKKALTMQLMEQRSLMEKKEAVVAKTEGKLARTAKLQEEGVRQVAALQKELSGKSRMCAAVQAEVARLRGFLQHREALLRAAAAQVMSVLDTVKEKEHWLAAKNQVETIVLPILEKEGLDGLDPGEAAAEQSRQRVKMQETIHKMREALRQEHQNNEQQNLVRVEENLELTRDLNLMRKKNAELGAEVKRLEAKIKFDKLRWKQQQGARYHTSSAPDFLGALTLYAPVAGAPRLRSLKGAGVGGLLDGNIDHVVVGGGGGLGSDGGCNSDGGGGDGEAKKTQQHSRSDDAGIDAGRPDCGGSPAVPRTPDSAAVAASLRGVERATTSGAAGGMRQLRSRQRLRHPSPLTGNVAASAAATRPETCGNTVRPAAAAAAAAHLRGRSDRLAAGAGGRQNMRVLLPGQGARDYSSLLKGSGSVRGRELEARVATAEAEAVWLARENHRIKIECERAVRATEADAERAVAILTAELQRIRATAAAAAPAAAASTAGSPGRARAVRIGAPDPGGRRHVDPRSRGGLSGVPSHLTCQERSAFGSGNGIPGGGGDDDDNHAADDSGSSKVCTIVRIPSPTDTTAGRGQAEGLLSLSAPTTADDDDDEGYGHD